MRTHERMPPHPTFSYGKDEGMPALRNTDGIPEESVSVLKDFQRARWAVARPESSMT
ncbi:MAG: hypothetical protein AAF400_01175 [Bacteroidota bacterium]